QDVLMEALALLPDAALHTTLIGAEFPVHQSFAALVRSKAGSSKVDFAGAKSGEMVLAALQSADLLIMPSRTEACPVALIEAAATGLPVIATRVGDVEVLVGEDYPFLVPPEDPKALAVAIDAFLRMSQEKRRSIGIQLRARIVEQCSS